MVTFATREVIAKQVAGADHVKGCIHWRGDAQALYCTCTATGSFEGCTDLDFRCIPLDPVYI